MDEGLLILRLVVGALFVGHGTQKLFGWFGGHGVQGTGQFYASSGFRPGVPFAVLGGLSETGGGVLLALGLLTPLGAAAIIGMMTTAAIAIHLKNGMWNTNGGMELPVVYATASATLAFVGPGRYSLDRALGWDLAGVPWGVGAIVLGLVASSVVLAWRVVQLGAAVPAPNDDHHQRAA
jgi:putative oxidoreductase